MYEEAESILKKLPKPVEEDVDPPAESWSASPLRRSLHSPTSCHPAKMTRKKKTTTKKQVLALAEWMGMFLLHLTEVQCQGRGEDAVAARPSSRNKGCCIYKRDFNPTRLMLSKTFLFVLFLTGNNGE